jgi:predicted ATPase/DNA-binding CsgD family transcriptional regulator
VAPGVVHGLAGHLSRFVGRSAEIGEVSALLSEFRMVTLTGPGGMGKTRLAGQVARAVAAEFADGAWLAELAGVQDPALVAEQVAAALGVPAGDAGSMAGLLVPRQLLLVLDNCEHVLASAARLCAAILQVADDVRILATSREPVGVPGEARYRLGPLTLPAPGGPPGIAESDAVILFADRARRADPRFELGADTGPAVARLVRQLDGMPLAIELAAARVEALGLTELADGLDNWLGLLVGTDRTAAERQRSLAATAGWSYRLLPEADQRAFRQLAVFPGGFTLEAARAVAGPGAAAAVLRLVDCSMALPPRAGGDGRTRYTMLATLRAYGLDQLAGTSDAAKTPADLAQYAAGVAEQAGPDLLTGASAAAMRWLDAEAANMEEAVRWSLEHESATAVRLAAALSQWWSLRGQHRSGAETLTRVLPHAEPGSEPWCEIQLGLATLAASSGRGAAAALDHLTAVTDALADKQPTPVLVRALAARGGMLANLGRLAEAGPVIHEALERARQIGYSYGEAQALYWLAGISHYAGDQVEHLSRARQLALIDPAELPSSMVQRSKLALTMALIEVGELAEAEQAGTGALELAQQEGNITKEGQCHFNLARIALMSGRLPAAAAGLRAALDCAVRASAAVSLLDILDVCGHYLTAAGNPAASLTLWAAHAALRQAAGLTDPVEDARRRAAPMELARRGAGGREAAAAESRGSAMTLGAAAEYALLTVVPGAEQDPGSEDQPAPAAGLSAREQELVTLVARGQTDAQIAAGLFISISTVRSHLDRIRDKTGCRRRADITRLALQTGLI